jgi:hypothetical protein
MSIVSGSMLLGRESKFDPSTPVGTYVGSQGGYFAGTFSLGAETYALFMSPLAYVTKKAWKTSGTSTSGISSSNGFANTEAMNNSSHPAAEYVRGLSAEGFTDWFMPSRVEAELVYDGYIAGSPGSPSGLQRFWTSEQVSSTNAYFQRLDIDESGNVGKTNAYQVWPVRRLLLA